MTEAKGRHSLPAIQVGTLASSGQSWNSTGSDRSTTSVSEQDRIFLRKQLDQLDLSMEAALRAWAFHAVTLPPVELELERSNRIAVLDGLVLWPERVVDAALNEARGSGGCANAVADSPRNSARLAVESESNSPIHPPIEPATVQPPHLAKAPDILGLAAQTLRRTGVVGEDRLVELLYLVLTSRLLDKPVAVAVKGPSSAGKSFVVDRVCDLFPASAYYFLSGMSEHALAYSQEPMSHRVLVICEAAGVASDVASYFMRTFLSEGKISYDYVDKTSGGMQLKHIEREGPIGLIVTTTAVSLHPENETRLLSVTATDTPAQTSAVMLAAALGGPTRPVTLQCWRGLQEWLETAEHRVSVPYAEDLAREIPPVSIRLRRDFTILLCLIRSHALLHQLNRQRADDGSIIATLDDYARVRDLVVDLVGEQVQATVSAAVRDTVHAVDALRHEHDHVTFTHVAERLDLDKSTAQRRAKVAISRGYLQNDEDRRGKPARLVLGEPLPEELEVLPAVEALGGCTVAEASEGNPT
jgi:hypothetical protein